MATYSVNTEVMNSGAMDLRRVTQQIQNSLTALDASKNAFMAANRGHTIENYDMAQQQWNAGLLEMNQALDLAHRDLLSINDNYVNVDQRNAARMPSGRG